MMRERFDIEDALRALPILPAPAPKQRTGETPGLRHLMGGTPKLRLARARRPGYGLVGAGRFGC